jgi:acyl-CoA thioester hydrolase
MSATGPEPLRLHRDRIGADWVDYNGHMNEAYYVLIFSRATDAFMDRIGLGPAGRARSGFTLFTGEARIRYLHEALEGEEVAIESLIRAWDEKRLVLHHRMLNARTRSLLAETEMLLLSVDQRSRRVAPFPPAVAEKLAALTAAHGDPAGTRSPEWSLPDAIDKRTATPRRGRETKDGGFR